MKNIIHITALDVNNNDVAFTYCSPDRFENMVTDDLVAASSSLPSNGWPWSTRKAAALVLTLAISDPRVILYLLLGVTHLAPSLL